ncbi:hypothetical protein ACJ7K1_29065 [Paenibacillus elgii]
MDIDVWDWNVGSTDAAAVTRPKQDILASVRSNSRGKNQIISLMHDDDHKDDHYRNPPLFFIFASVRLIILAKPSHTNIIMKGDESARWHNSNRDLEIPRSNSGRQTPIRPEPIVMQPKHGIKN